MNANKVIHSNAIEEFAQELDHLEQVIPRRINADPDKVEQGLAKLVLTLIELIRKLLEKQAIRRIEGGSLTEDEIERLGETLMKLEQKLAEIKTSFGLADQDLNLNLGPLGNLL